MACVGFEQITSLGTAAGLTPPAGAKFALVQSEAQNVRMRGDGTNPTASVGIILVANAAPLVISNLAAAKFIEVTGSAKLNVEYYN